MSAATAAIGAVLLAASQADPAPAPAPQVAATLYAWYDHPDAHFVDATGRDLLRDHFVAPELVHSGSPEWFAGEFADAADAGLDLLLCASVGTSEDAAAPGAPWIEALAAGLERTRGRLARPVGAALLIEPWLLAAQHGGVFDLGDAARREAALATILAFQRTVRPEDWGRIEGAPLVVFGRVNGGGDGGRGSAAPAEFVAELRKRFHAAFGREPFLLFDRSWSREGAPAPGDGTWREGSAILGPQHGAIASLAPGFDDRQVEHPRGVVRPREGGRAYAWAWQQLLGERHALVIVESWNQFHDGTAIAPSLEHGRRYVDLTRRYAELLRRGARESESERAVPRFDGPVGAADFTEDRVFATRDDVVFRPGDEEGGIALQPGADARLAFVAAANGAALQVGARARGGTARVRFRMSAAFPAATPERYVVTVQYTAIGEAAHLELAGAGEDEAPAGAARAARFEVVSLPKHDRNGSGGDLELLVRGGTIELQEIHLRRTRHRLASESGEPAPFRRIALDWSAFEPKPGELDEARLRAQLGLAGDPSPPPRDDAAARGCAVVVLQSPPDWAIPIAVHPDEIAATVRRVVAAMAEEPALRVLELFPRANRAGVVSKVPDVQGYVRVLRAASTAAHAVAPNVALALGAIEGPDVPWLRTIQGLKQPFTYDAATFEWTEESGTPGDATCEREFVRMLEQWRAGGDDDKPFFVTRSEWIGRPGPEGRWPSRSSIEAATRNLPVLLRFAWRRLGRAPERIAVLDEEALPLVHGVPSAQVVAALGAAGFEASALATPALEQALDGGTSSTVVLAQGELFPESLAPKIVPFVDRGGLLVTFGGAPLRRPAQRAPDGGFTLRDESPIGLELRDRLRIEVAPWDPGPFDSKPVVDLGAEFDGGYGAAAWFTRRAGRPRDLRGIHRFEPLLEMKKDGAILGADAALLTYGADRKGALLLIGDEGGGRIIDDVHSAAIDAAMRALARKCGALAAFTLGDAVANGSARK